MRPAKPLFILCIASLIVSSASAQSNATETIATIDKATHLSEAYWGRETTFTIESDIPKMITITDINSIKDSGAGKVNFKQVRLSPGVNNVSMSLEADGKSRGVTISDSDDMIYASNPGQPFFATVSTTDLYTLPWVIALEMSLIVFGIISWKSYKWGRKMRQTL